MKLHGRLNRHSLSALLTIGLFGLASPALAQPSEAQMGALKQNCRSDYMSKCMSVKPGGPEAFQCLKRNEASLSAACKSAVDAISGAQQAKPAAPAQPASPPPAAVAAPKPAPASPPPAAAAPAPKPAVAAAPAAPKPTTPKPAAPKPAVAAAPPPAAAAPAAPAPAVMPAPKLDSPQEARLIKQFCFTDFKVLCKGVRLGQGRAVQCLAANAPALSPGCKAAMAQASR